MTASRGIGRGNRRGEDHGRAVLTAPRVAEMRRRVAGGATFAEVAAWAGVSRPAARAAVTGATWAHVLDVPPVRRLRRWSQAELAVLAARGEDVATELAPELGRTPHAVRQQRYKRGRS